MGTVSFAGINDLLAPYVASHPVLGLVNDIDASVVSAKVGVPWYQLGWKIGRWLADRHPAGGAPADIAWLPGPQDADWVGFIDRGFRAALAGSAVRIATVRHGDTGRSIQRQLVEEVLDAHPKLDYLVGNAPMAEAAIAEVRRRQREDSVGIVASYVTPGVYSGMVRGRILASVTDFPVLQGRMAVRQSLARARGPGARALHRPERRTRRAGHARALSDGLDAAAGRFRARVRSGADPALKPSSPEPRRRALPPLASLLRRAPPPQTTRPPDRIG